MADTVLGAEPARVRAPLRPWYLVAAAIAIAVMIAAIRGGSVWFLDFVHVMAGALWTGIDLFMGFVVGPVLRKVSLDTRRAMIAGIMPRTLVLMPTLSAITTTAGWFLAERLGFLDLAYPQFYWVIAALAIVTVLTVQGLGYLLPMNLKLYFEIQKPAPDPDKLKRWMRTYVRVVAVQGSMQVAIIVVMAKFATGF
jgi:ABC-type enterobactin transport system permease subunit